MAGVSVIDRLRGRLRDGRHDDAGTTMLEIMVGMTIMAVFMTIFTTAVYAMSRSADKVAGVTTTAGQVNQAFLRLDKLVRYATAITTAGRSSTSNMWYVELETTANGPDVCTQLRVDTTKSPAQLQQRSWTMTGTTASAASSWTMLANGVTNGAAPAGALQPFSVPSTVAASSPFQQLMMTLVVTTGSATTTTTKSRMTFTAVNSLLSATTNATKCQQKGRP